MSAEPRSPARLSVTIPVPVAAAPAVARALQTRRRLTDRVGAIRRSAGFPWTAPTWPSHIERPPVESTLGADFDTEWSRRLPARVARAVVLDGVPVFACLIAVETIQGASVDTLEGVSGPDGELDEVQAAFLEGFATQCGFCTSGMIMVAEALLAENPDPSHEDIVRAISGNVCRCTGYALIIAAIRAAAARRAAAAAVA